MGDDRTVKSSWKKYNNNDFSYYFRSLLKFIFLDIPFCGLNQRDEKSFDAFLKFLKSNESKCDNILIKKIDDSNYGIIANQDFKVIWMLFYSLLNALKILFKK